MFVGMLRLEIFIPNSGSLKTKRQTLRPALERVRNKLHVAVSEIDHHDLWQRAAIGVSCVSSSVDGCRKVMQDVEKVMGGVALQGAEIVDRAQHIVAFDDL